MHAIELAELASVFAGLSSDMLSLGCVPNRLAGQKYWLEARFRHDFWSSKLATHRHDLQFLNVSNRKRSWIQILPIIEEILLSEPLARCIAYHGRLLAERQIDSDLSALSQSVLTSHIEARHRCLHLIVFGEGLAIEHSKRLNQLRRTLESYNDMLLSFLQPIGPPDPFSFDPLPVHRAQGSRVSLTSETVHSKRLQLSSLRIALRFATNRRLGDTTPSQHSNRKMHDAVIGFFPEKMFDSFGLPLSGLMANLLKDSSESSATMEVLSQPTSASIGFLFEPHRSKAGPASTKEPRW